MKTLGMREQNKPLINVASIIKQKSNNVPDFIIAAAHVAALFSYYSDNYSSYNFNE